MRENAPITGHYWTTYSAISKKIVLIEDDLRCSTVIRVVARKLHMAIAGRPCYGRYRVGTPSYNIFEHVDASKCIKSRRTLQPLSNTDDEYDDEVYSSGPRDC